MADVFGLSEQCRKRKATAAFAYCESKAVVNIRKKRKAGRDFEFPSVWGRFDNYETLNPISSGSSGAVYRARDKRSGEIVAVKAELGGFTAAAVMEIEILASLGRHPAIVEFKDAVVDDNGGLYVIMEHVEYDFNWYMHEKKELSAAEIKNFMRQLLIGVKFLHDNNVVHRDLKSDNILINKKGVLKICDFGLSLRTDAAPAAYNPCVGTAWYIAPELLASKQPRTQVYPKAVDMWSLGCVMAEMLLRDGAYWSDEVAPTVYRIVSKGGGADVLRRQFPGAAISGAGFDLLDRLMCLDPKWRITAESALSHPWFKESRTTRCPLCRGEGNPGYNLDRKSCLVCGVKPPIRSWAEKKGCLSRLYNRKNKLITAYKCESHSTSKTNKIVYWKRLPNRKCVATDWLGVPHGCDIDPILTLWCK